MKIWTRAAIGLAAFVLGSAAVAQAQTPEQFYKGKTIDLTIGYPPGGSNDIYARILAQHLGKHIPGQPTVVARNLPGAGSFLAVNQMAATAPKDGTALAIGAPTLTKSSARRACATRRRSSTGSAASPRSSIL